MTATPRSIVRPVRGLLALAIGLQVLASIAALVPLVAIASVVTPLREGRPIALGGVIAVIAGASIVAIVATSAANWVSHAADASLAAQVRKRIARVVRGMPLHRLHGVGGARVRAIALDDTAALHTLVAHTMLDVTALVTTPLLGTLVVFAFDPLLGAVALVPLAAGLWWFRLAMRGSGAHFAEYATHQDRINRTITDLVHGLPVAKLFGGEGGAGDRYDRAVIGFHTSFRGWSRPTSGVTTASWLVVAPAITVTLLVTVGLGAMSVGWSTMEGLVTAALLGPAISAPVAVIGPRIQALRSGLHSIHSIAAFLGSEQLTWGDQEPARGGAVEVHDASVRYGDLPALTHAHLALPTKGLIAVVGASGSGKSTLVQLLTRGADPDLGRVTIGGVDLRNLTESALHERIAFVLQDAAVRTASIHDIVSGGTPTSARPVSADRLNDLLRAVGLDATMARLPHGVDTIIGDGIDLSGGERQRLALLRAIQRQPDVLILDEILSGLDPRAYDLVLTLLRDTAKERLVVLVSHELHWTSDADAIVVLDEGAIVGAGSFDEVRATCPQFRALLIAAAASGSER